MCTPVDVLFILLPALDKAAAAGTFCDLEQCLESLGSPHAHRLVPLLSNGQLECICDAKEAGGARYYRLNEAKALAWLRLKVEKTKAALIASSPQFGSLEDTALTVYAAGILGEYMTKDWSAKLATALNLPSEMQAGGDGIKALAPQGYNPDLIMPSQDREAKKPRLDPAAAAKAKALEARQAAKAAKLAKEAAGMRKLSSFFTKKG